MDVGHEETEQPTPLTAHIQLTAHSVEPTGRWSRIPRLSKWRAAVTRCSLLARSSARAASGV